VRSDPPAVAGGSDLTTTKSVSTRNFNLSPYHVATIPRVATMKQQNYPSDGV
jgi:hypothetical protein